MLFRQEGKNNTCTVKTHPCLFLCFPRKLHPAAPAEAQLNKMVKKKVLKKLGKKEIVEKMKWKKKIKQKRPTNSSK